jgi:hypothetical protein
METYSISIYRPVLEYSAVEEFEEALRYKALCYNMRHLLLTGIINQEDVLAALQKAIQICKLAGINSADHFKPLYVFDVATGVTYTDWLMSKKGFSLIMMQLPLNEQTAHWLLEFAAI